MNFQEYLSALTSHERKSAGSHWVFQLRVSGDHWKICWPSILKIVSSAAGPSWPASCVAHCRKTAPDGAGCAAQAAVDAPAKTKSATFAPTNKVLALTPI